MHAVLAALLDVLPGRVALVFLLPAIEASTLAGVVIPGETALLYGGVLAWYDRVPLPAVFAAGRWAPSSATPSATWWARAGANGSSRAASGADRRAALGARPPSPGAQGAVRRSSPAASRPSRARWCRSWQAARACPTTGSCSATSSAAWCGPSPLLGYLAGDAWRRVERIQHIVGWSWPRGSSTVVMLIVRGRRRRRRAGRGQYAAARA